VKTTTDNSVQQGATNSGGVLASYRYFFSDSHGVEVDYGYSLNTQTYGLAAELHSFRAERRRLQYHEAGLRSRRVSGSQVVITYRGSDRAGIHDPGFRERGCPSFEGRNRPCLFDPNEVLGGVPTRWTQESTLANPTHSYWLGCETDDESVRGCTSIHARFSLVFACAQRYLSLRTKPRPSALS
jgi:hypothetical protein